MRMKNEQRYRGIIPAQMKDLGVLLPKCLGAGREGAKGVKEEEKKDYKKDCIIRFLFLSCLYFNFYNHLFSLLSFLIVNRCAILARQWPGTEHVQTSI